MRNWITAAVGLIFACGMCIAAGIYFGWWGAGCVFFGEIGAVVWFLGATKWDKEENDAPDDK